MLTTSPKSADKQAKGLVQAPFYFTRLHYGQDSIKEIKLQMYMSWLVYICFCSFFF